MGTFSVYQPAPPSQQNQQPVPSGVYNPSPGSGDLYQQRARAAFGIPGNPNYPGMFGGNTGVTGGMLGPVAPAPSPQPDPRVSTMPMPYQQGPSDGHKSTLKDFLMNPQAGSGQGMQFLTGMIGHVLGNGGNSSQPYAGPFQSTAVAQSARPMMPMRGLFGSAMGGAAQVAPQVARVMMRAPDGTVQSVDPAHVDHYTGLGAQVVNGSSYGGGGY